MIIELPVVKPSRRGKIPIRRIVSIRQCFIRVASFILAPRATISQRYNKFIFHNAKEIYKDSLQSLPYVDGSQRNDLRNSLRHYAVNYARILIPLQRVSRVSEFLWVPAFFVAMALGNTLGYNESQLVAAIVEIIAVGIGVGISINFSRIARRESAATITMVLISVVTFCSIILLYDPNFPGPLNAIPRAAGDQILNVVIDSALIFASTILTACATLTIAYVVFALAVYRKIDRRPEIMIASLLLGLLKDLEGSGGKLGDVTFKAHVCTVLGAASALLKYKLPKAIGLLPIQARKQFNERCRSGVSELRDMQVRIVLMDENTVDTLKHDIVRYIGIATQGKYGLLPTGAPAIRNESRKLVFARVMKGMFIAFVPVGCLMGARYAGLGLTGSLANWAIIAGLGWAAITLISTFDPTYRTRLNDIRNIISMIRGKGN